MSAHEHSAETEALLLAYLDDRLDDAALGRLGEALQADPALRARLVECSLDRALLKELFVEASVAADLDAARARTAREVRAYSARPLWAASLAAALLAAVALFASAPERPETPVAAAAAPKPPAAVVEAANNAAAPVHAEPPAARAPVIVQLAAPAPVKLDALLQPDAENRHPRILKIQAQALAAPENHAPVIQGLVVR